MSLTQRRVVAPILTVTGEGWSSRVLPRVPRVPGNVRHVLCLDCVLDTDMTSGGDNSGATSDIKMFCRRNVNMSGSGVEFRENAPES